MGWLLISFAACAARAQSSLPPAPTPQPEVTLRAIPSNIVHDQAAIWTSPARFRTADLDWFVPLAAATGVAIATDSDAMRHVVPQNTDLNQKSLDASNGLTGILAASPVALLGWGQLRHNPRAREAGILGGEAMVDGLAVEEASRLIFRRERPYQGNADGRFFTSAAGADSSFPSLHTVVAWSSAAVLAGEYSSPLSRFLIYSAATGVTATRVMGQQHFPSDVIVGSAAGWLIGHYVFHKRHNPKLDIPSEDY